MKQMTLTTPAADLRQPSAPEQDLLTGREVLRQEAHALMQLADRLDGSFGGALDLMQKALGRVVVTGMGKSGHVGKKMAATFASTGTPSFFVHPAEASHGDLGMITDNDVVLALSKGGESPELRDVINYCKRFTIPLIAITQNPQSTLARQSDVVLMLPDLSEACPNQQAPTTSTTVTMAYGDALAVGLMKRRGFSATDFRQFHPGGKLGGQLLAVRSVMKSGNDLPLVRDTDSTAQAITTMSEKNYGCAIVTDAGGKLAGFITDGDIRRHIAPDLVTKTVASVMHAKPLTIPSDALAAAALAVMNQHTITQLIVVENDIPVGLVRLHDIMRAGAA